MATIEDMRKTILPILKEKYAGSFVPAPVDIDAVVRGGFMLEEHAEAIRKLCAKQKYIVSFREAGAASLTRIRAGHPCKGHKIMDKSIKKKGGVWTYSLPKDADLKEYEGLIGYPESKTDNTLKGLWKVDSEGKCVQNEWKKNMKIDSCYFTGDYDLHDLLCLHKSNGNYVRILADTPEERNALEQLNRAMISANENGEGFQSRRNKVSKFIKDHPQKRMTESEFSLVRHGAQTSFMCYLLGEVGVPELKKYLESEDARNSPKLPWEDAVMNISDCICVFDDNENIYILKGINEIFAYYQEKGLDNFIPFYYFFKELRKDPKYVEMINEYAIIINGYLGKHIKSLNEEDLNQ